jgi:hypothetical protein
MKNILNIKGVVVFTFLATMTLTSCNDYLDVIPDDVATIEAVFNDKNTAKQYLYTCYSFLPSHRDLNCNPGMSYGGEFAVNQYDWVFTPSSYPRFLFETGNNADNPIMDYWSSSRSMFAAIRVCNYFLENVDKVPEMTQEDLNRWKAEVTFLKAYYHWWLFQMYGPIPIVDKNVGFTGDNDLAVYRNTKDECADYIVKLMDEAINSGALPSNINGVEMTDMGRITRPIAMAIKAKVLVTLASDLFNGNKDYEAMVDNRGTKLFESDYKPELWKKAADACKAAIDTCEAQGMSLYKFKAPTGTITNDSIDMTLQPAMILAGQLPDNSEIIWPQPEAQQGVYSDMQHRFGTPQWLYRGSFYNRREIRVGYEICGSLGVSLNFAETFYSDKGVPIDEDKTYYPKTDWFKPDADYSTRTDHDNYIKHGCQTNYFNLHREPRFYGSIAIRGSLIFGLGNTDKKDMYYCLFPNKERVNASGMCPRKWVPYLSTPLQGQILFYHWPIMRLADLYLLYAEALNECTEGNGTPAADVYKYINLVRERAGLKSVQESWDNYSIYPDKYKTKVGMRDIIRQERRIELCFEGHAWFDLRRWKLMETLFGTNTIRGYNVQFEKNEDYISTPTAIHTTTYSMKNNLWPIRNTELHKDLNLVQNTGW